MQIIKGIKMHTSREVAEIIGIHESTVRNYIKKGKLQGARIGANYMVTEENMMKFIQGEK